MSRSFSFTVLGVAAVLGGCLMPHQGPKGGVVATGQPLAVVDDVKVWTTTSKEKVAEATYHDSSGRQVGSAAIYEDKTRVHTKQIWYPVQGNEQLSDEDFFRIAGDQKAADETLAMRANGKKWHRRGIGTLIGSVGAMIGSYFIPNPTARTLLLVGSSVGFMGGYYMTYWGAHQMNPETHALDRSIAERAAIQYNQQLGHVGGVSVNRNF